MVVVVDLWADHWMKDLTNAIWSALSKLHFLSMISFDGRNLADWKNYFLLAAHDGNRS